MRPDAPGRPRFSRRRVRAAIALGLLLVAQVMGHWTMAGTLALGNAGSDATRAAMAGIIAAYVPGR